MIGKVLDGRYRIVRQLGAGGFAKTYLAQDTRIPYEPLCVVKHLHPQTSDSEQLKIATRLFNSEAESLAKLGTHPQIPQLLAYFCQEGEFYLVEEFVEGQPLTAEMNRIWRAEAVRGLLIEVLEILDFIHKNGVIHRDVKPDNLIRRRSDGKLVLIDFGAIKAISQTVITTSGSASATVAVGTIGYMAPEQAQGKPRPSSDIYSLGMIAIQALTGRLPRDLQEDVKTGEVAWQHLVEEDTPLLAVVHKMTRYLFRDRFDSALSVLSALQPTLPTLISPQTNSLEATPATEVIAPVLPQAMPSPVGYQTSDPTKSQTETVTPHRKSRVNWMLWLNVVLSGVLLGLAGYLFWQKQRSSLSSTATPEPNMVNTPSPSVAATVTPTPTPTVAPQPPDSPLTQAEAVEVVRQLISAKAVIFAPPYDETVLRNLTTGEELVRRNGSRTWLANNNAYYSYGAFEVRSPSRFSVRDNQAAIEIEIVEEPTLFINGVVDASQSGRTSGRYYAILRRENGVWKVANLSKVN